MAVWDYLHIFATKTRRLKKLLVVIGTEVLGMGSSIPIQ